MVENKPNCYKCVFRGTLAGDCHSRCTHPQARSLEIVGNDHGKKNGWFNWPYNFDPIWLQKCNGYTPRNEEVQNG